MKLAIGLKQIRDHGAQAWLRRIEQCLAGAALNRGGRIEQFADAAKIGNGFKIRLGHSKKGRSLPIAEFRGVEYHLFWVRHVSETPLPNGAPPVTRYLRDWRAADPDGAGRVIEAVYAELRVMASRLLNAENAGHTLQPTALVHELYLRLGEANPPQWEDRGHFFAVAANTLRRILIDHARANLAEKRGGNEKKVSLDLADAGVTCSYDDLLRIDEALTSLEQTDPRAARVTELRFFAGLEEREIAEQLGVAEITVKRDWKFARAWLAKHLAR